MSGVIGIPEEEWTAGQREFVGSEFETPKGGVLTVVGVQRQGKHPKFFLECSICSADEEMWPEGSIVQVRDKLLLDKFTCGCNKKVQWTKEQFKIRVERFCKEKDYKFLGFPYGQDKGARSKVKVYNPESGNTWEVTIDNLLNNGRGDPATRYKRGGEKRQNTLEDIKERARENDTNIDRYNIIENVASDKRKAVYTCDVCSDDEYVTNNLCSGTFEMDTQSFIQGARACRCSNYYWNQEQREYQIGKVCKENGYPFLGWESKDGYKNAWSRIVTSCDKGHQYTVAVASFLSNNFGCKQCATLLGSCNGYYPHKKEDKDFLYFINLNSAYLKVGRSFYLDERFSDIARKAKIKKHQIALLSCYTGLHKEVFDTEQWIHEELRGRGFQYNKETWSTELFERGCEDLVEYLLSK